MALNVHTDVESPTWLGLQLASPCRRAGEPLQGCCLSLAGGGCLSTTGYRKEKLAWLLQGWQSPACLLRDAASQPLCQLCWPCPIPRQWSHPSPMPSGESLQWHCATLPGHIGLSVTSTLVCASRNWNESGLSCVYIVGTCRLHLRAE